MKDKIQKMKSGYALIEMLFYIALFSILTLAVINSLIAMTKAFRETSVRADIVQSSAIMERISREIKTAYSISSISGSDLRLNTTDENGNNKTVRFLLSGTDVEFYDNDVLIGDLNTPNAEVASLDFTEITTVAGKAIRVILSVSSARDSGARVEDFFTTAVLRGSYAN